MSDLNDMELMIDLNDMRDTLDQLDDTRAQVRERLDLLLQTIKEEMVAVNAGKITLAEGMKRARAHKKEIQKIHATHDEVTRIQDEVQRRTDKVERILRRRVS